MNIKTITAPLHAKYYSDFLEVIPENCINDKGITGCGGTTLAIQNQVPTIIAMPYKNLIYNKVKQHTHLLGVSGDTTTEEIIAYAQHTSIIKIAVTYDSLNKVIDALQSIGMNPKEDIFLLVDEEHVLVNSYVFRNRAIKNLIKVSREFKRVTYMTATPIDEEFLLEELQDLPVVKIKWSNKHHVDIVPNQTNRPAQTVCTLIDDALKNKLLGNLHFFVNSVTFIGEIIQTMQLQPECVRIICSDVKQTDKKSNQLKLGEEYQIENMTTSVKKINFYTSTAFEGCDIYDENGRTYIVSDESKASTLLDISTLFIQIAGRIRNSHYAGEIVHIFNTTRYSSNVTLEEYKKSTLDDLEKSKELIRGVNTMPVEARKTIINSLKETGFDKRYIHFENDQMDIDENLYKLDIRNFKITNQIYRSSIALREEYMERGFRVKALQTQNFTDKLAANSQAKISFKDLFIEYSQLKDQEGHVFCLGNRTDRVGIIEMEKPIIPQAYKKLGKEKVAELNYNVTNIKRELIKLTDEATHCKLVKMLEEIGYRIHTQKTVSRIKADLQDIYTSLGIIRKAKATDIQQWFDCKKTSPKINGKTTDCLTIIRKKTVY